MNTIKFSKLENITTEQHNLEVHSNKEIVLFGNKLNLYTPCNLNIFITNKCHSNCFFCINKDFSNSDINDDFYYFSLKETLSTLNPKYTEITITGGEPTINMTRFINTLTMCNEMGFKFRTISTTGLNLLKKYNQKELCQHMIEQNAIHNINISRMSVSNNDEIFKSKNITNKDISKLANFFYMHDAEMRISCNLILGYVDSFEKMLDFVSYYEKLDVQTIMFRELVSCNNIKLNDIFKPNEDFLFIKTLHSESYNVNVYKYKNFLVKYYNAIPDNSNNIKTLSLRNGILAKNYSKIIKDFREDFYD